MKQSLSLVLAALLLAACADVSAQEKNDPKPIRPPVVDGPAALPGFQPPGIGFPGGADHKELVATLIEVLDDPDAEVRQAVATALGKIGRQAVSPLLGILKDKDKSASLRASAAQALGHAGPQAQEALPELTKAVKEKDKELKKQSAFAIGKIVQGHGFGFGGLGVPPIILPGGGIEPIKPGAVPIVPPPDKKPPIKD